MNMKARSQGSTVSVFEGVSRELLIPLKDGILCVYGLKDCSDQDESKEFQLIMFHTIKSFYIQILCGAWLVSMHHYYDR